jgi:type VI secretion system protein ImpC
VQIETLSAGRDDFLDVFYEKVFLAEHGGVPEVPLSAVVLGYEFDRGADDVDVLRHAARMGESLRVPFLAAAAPAFWGIRQPALLANLPDLARKVEGSEYAKWNLLRREEAALWLCLAANRLAFRDPADSGRSLWSSGAYALGAAFLDSFLASGARFAMTGPAAELAGLPAPPVEVFLSDQKALEISRAGLAPLVGRKGGDSAHFPAAPAVYLPKRYDQEEATRSAAAVATLPYQAFAGAAAHALERIGRGVAAGSAPEAVQELFEAGLQSLLDGQAPPEVSPETAAETPPPVAVEVHPDPESPDTWQVIVRLRPAFPISGSTVDLVLGHTVPR